MNTANHRKYEKYYDSSVEWLGSIPHGWITRRLKYVVDIRKRIAGREGIDVLSITQQGIKIKDIDSGEGQLASDYSKYQHVKKGEFAMNHMDLLTGYVDISSYDGVVSPDYRVFANVSDEVLDKYLLFLFQIGYKNRIFFKYGQGVSLLGRWRFPRENFDNFIIPIPSLEEQQCIISFLNVKLKKIDRAISIMEKQIALLNERKQIIIQQAVTKGLNPNVQMKDSGIDWIGEIPAHWEMKRLKYLVLSSTGYAFSSEIFSEYGIPVIRISDLLSDGEVDTKKTVRIPYIYSSYFSNYGVNYGDILMAMTGGTIGKVSLYTANFPSLLNQRVCKFTSKSILHNDLLLLWMKTKIWSDHIDLEADGGAQPNISDKIVLELVIPLPLRVDEQNEIVLYLTETITKTDAVIIRKQQQIATLQEYKSTLIYEAVTGKIKVT